MGILKMAGAGGLLLALAAGVWLFWPRAVLPVQDRAIGPVMAGGGIAVLGTSLSHGNWPETLVADLEVCNIAAGPVVKVTKPGANARWGLDRVDEVITATPALVLVEFAINDADILDGLGRRNSRAILQNIVSGLQNGLPEGRVALMTTNPVSGVKRRLQRPFMEEYYAIVREVAAEYGVGLIDLEPRWAAAMAQGLRLPDGLHPTPESFSDVALPVIRRAVAQGFGQECTY